MALMPDSGHGVQRLLAFELAARLDGVRLLGADLLIQAQPLHLRGGLHIRQELIQFLDLALGVQQRLTGEHTGAHHTGGTQVTHQLTGVDAADAHNALLRQIIVEAAFGTPVAHVRAGIADHIAGDPDAGGFRILAVHTGIADMREGLHHNLTVVARIGKSLLIAGHGSGEHDLAGRLAFGPVRLAYIYLTIFQNENGLILVTDWFVAHRATPLFSFGLFKPRVTFITNSHADRAYYLTTSILSRLYRSMPCAPIERNPIPHLSHLIRTPPVQ